MILAAKVIAALAGGYLLTGLAVGIAFLLFRLDKQYPAARGAYAFRPLLLPGLALLWPVVLRRWMAGGAANVASHKRAHWVIWAAMALLLVIIFGLAASIGPSRLPEEPSRRLSLAAGAVL